VRLETQASLFTIRSNNNDVVMSYLHTYFLSDMTSFQNKNNMADSEERKSLIRRFVSVSGVSEERAKFFLEAASWNLEV